MDTRVVINPIALSEEDIRCTLETLWDSLNDSTDEAKAYAQKYVLEERGEDFITEKNAINNVEEALFTSGIKPNLKYADLIESFLGDPINSEYQKKYFEITNSIQKYCNKGSEDECKMELVFERVFDDVINYKNSDSIDGSKLLIVLHNMYFNCDIGNNPSI